MGEHDVLAERFETHRPRLRAIAYQTLGSGSEADDAVQEAWLRLSRTDPGRIENLGGWLTTAVARVCLNILAARREQPVGVHLPESAVGDADGTGPEAETLLADSIGPALLVILHTLAPAERLAFILHDIFAVPFDDIAVIVGRSAAATRQLASRARRRVQGVAPIPGADLARQRAITDAFLTAARNGDFGALLEILDPDVVVRSNGTEAVRGAAAAAGRAFPFTRVAQVIVPALINGAVGLVMAADGRPITLVVFTITSTKIAAIDLIDDPAASPKPTWPSTAADGPGSNSRVEFFCYHRDRPGSVTLRDELVEQHWSYMDRYQAQMIARGPTLDGETPTGSVHIADLPAPAAARAFAFDEPNYQAGVYRDVLLRRWRNLLGRTMWDFPGGPADGNRYLVLGLGAGPAADLAVPPDRDELIAYGPLLSDNAAAWLGTAVLLRAPDPDAARAILTPGRYAGIEVHNWQFGGRQ